MKIAPRWWGPIAGVAAAAIAAAWMLAPFSGDVPEGSPRGWWCAGGALCVRARTTCESLRNAEAMPLPPCEHHDRLWCAGSDSETWCFVEQWVCGERRADFILKGAKLRQCSLTP